MNFGLGMNAGFAEEMVVRVNGDDEPGRYWYSGAGELAQVGTFAADPGEVPFPHGGDLLD
jgi:hypothetical protein